MSTEVVTPNVTHDVPKSITINQSTTPNSIFEHAVCLSVGRAWPSLSRTLSKDFIATTADKKRVHASKDLYDSDELRKLQNLESALDMKLKTYCIPFPLKAGIYVLPKDFIPQVEQILGEHIEARQPLIDKFCERYDVLVAEAREALGDSFNPNDYSTAERVKHEFQFGYNYLQMTASDLLKEVSKDVLKREQDKMDQVWKDAGQAATDLLTTQMQGLVNGFLDKLKPTGPDGKKKIFRNTLLKPINEFINNFSPRNLNNNSQLKAEVEKMKALVEGIDPEDIRKNEALKDSLQKGFSEIKTILDAGITDAPIRAINLADDDEEDATVQAN